MAKGELNKSLGIVGGLYDVFNRMARECDIDEAKPLFAEMTTRFEKLARNALAGHFGKVAGHPQTLQQALDNVFEPMLRMYTLATDKPVLLAVWEDALKVFDSFEAPVIAALQKCQKVAPDKPFSVMKPIKFRYRQPVPA
ncbi:MAG: hypothetical protein ACAH83_05095 [Alphaproteobacteria bacterium]